MLKKGINTIKVSHKPLFDVLRPPITSAAIHPNSQNIARLIGRPMNGFKRYVSSLRKTKMLMNSAKKRVANVIEARTCAIHGLANETSSFCVKDIAPIV